jgi:hypothetical protein
VLKQSKVDVSKQVTERTQNSIHKYGITIYFNGWDNVAQCPLLNVMLTCPSGDVFIGSIDITREQKDALYICNALSGYIETIGIDNIVQICTNNALSMKSATNLLIYHFPSLYFQGCVFHCFDLLLEDWGKTTWAKQIVKKVNVVVFFIQQHHVPLTIFCCYETNLMLLNPIETWFITNFLMLERLFKFKLAIKLV